LRAHGNRNKLLLMSFPAESAFRAWAEEYQEISRDRKAGAEVIVLLAQGFTQ
jgi:hypothetical protein